MRSARQEDFQHGMSQASEGLRRDLRSILRRAQPKQTVTIAFDGVASMAKLSMQKQRRLHDWVSARFAAASFLHIARGQAQHVWQSACSCAVQAYS